MVENLSVNSLKGDLSNATTFHPPLFPLDNTFKETESRQSVSSSADDPYCALLHSVDDRTGPVAEEESWGTGRVASRTARVVRHRSTTGTRDTRQTNESRFSQHLNRKQYKP